MPLNKATITVDNLSEINDLIDLIDYSCRRTPHQAAYLKSPGVKCIYINIIRLIINELDISVQSAECRLSEKQNLKLNTVQLANSCK